MDTKRVIIPMLIAMALVFLWTPAMHQIYKMAGWEWPEDRIASTQPTTEAATQEGATTSISSTSAMPATGPTTQSYITNATSKPGGYHVVVAQPSTQPVMPTLGSIDKKSDYAMALDLSPNGASIASATLNQFKRAVDSDDPYKFETPYSGEGALTLPLATRSVTIGGNEVALWDVPWKLVSQSTNSATFEVVVADPSGKPALRIQKTFEVPTKTTPNQGYEVTVNQTVENLSSAPLSVSVNFTGPTQPVREVTRGPDHQVLGAYVDEDIIKIEPHIADALVKEKSTVDLTKSSKGLPLQWTGISGAYFQTIVRPDAPAGSAFAHVQAQSLNPYDPSDQINVALDYQYVTKTLAPSAQESLPLKVFLGPKMRSMLNGPYYSKFPLSYDETLVLTSGMCAFCTFQWLIDILVRLLGIFHFVLRDWGLAIIGLVVLVRLILHPITKRSQVSMMKMSKMGPEMEKLKKKYADDKDELNKQMMTFYKQQGAGPILGCLPLFLQMPIWIALWSALQSTFELRQAPFLWGFTWIKDLSKPDRLIGFHPIPLPFGLHIDAINLLPLLMAVVTWINQKYTPQAIAATPEQEQQQKMMKWMSLVIPLMFYNMPSGLNLYYVTSMALGIVESKRIRDHIKEREEAEKEGKVIVDAGKKKKKGDDDFGNGARRSKEPDKPKGWLAGKMADLQSKVEEIQRQAEKGQKKGK